MTLPDTIRRQASAFGCGRTGFADATVSLDEDHARYVQFVEAGYLGSMAWLGRNAEARRRVDGEDGLPGARTVIVCALPYHRDGRDESAGPAGTRVARYARGQDYHNFFRKRLRKLAGWIRETFPGHEARPMVDTAPVLERAWARRAGVGFVGKNGMLIVPGIGSYVLLGEVVTTLEIPPDAPADERCGACTACLDACPTGAFARPWVLDARRCIAYLTIEDHGVPPEPLRPSLGDRVFGCDACQEVCPFNRTAPPEPSRTAPFAPRARWEGWDLHALLTLDERGFARLSEGSPLRRAGRAGMVRNAALVAGNGGDRRHLPVLRTLAASDPEAAVRDAAAWACGRMDQDADDAR